MRNRHRLALVLGGLAVGLLLAEGLFRLVGPRLPDDMLTGAVTHVEARFPDGSRFHGKDNPPGGTVLYRGPRGDNTVHFDHRGLRGGGLPGDAGVLAVGDSFTAAVQVGDEETYTARLSTRLGVPVPNAGLNDVGTLEATEQLRRHGPMLPLRAVVLMFYLGNDLDNNAGHPPPGTGGAPPPSVQQRTAVAALSRVSHLFRAAWLQRGRRPAGGPAPDIQPFIDPQLLQERLPWTEHALTRFGTVCRGLEVPCMVALAPPAWAVHDERLAPTLRYLRLDGATPDVDRVVRAVTGAVPAGIPVVDLTPALRAAAADQELYGRYDPHWTPAGHAVVAEALADPVRALLGE